MGASSLVDKEKWDVPQPSKEHVLRVFPDCLNHHCLSIQHLARKACGPPSFARSVRIRGDLAAYLRDVGGQVAHPRRPKEVQRLPLFG